MKKTLKDFMEVYKPKSPDEQKFVDKHVTIKHKDRNGNGDDVFKATNIKTIKRKEERHGYDVGEDEKVYEEVEDLDEAPFDAQSKAQDRHYEKQTPRVQNMLDKYAIRGMSYKDAVKKISSKTHILHKEITPLHEDADLDEVLDEAIDLLMSIDEKTLTPAEMKKREEVVKAIKRENPKMDKSMAYAVATKTAKRVAEGKIPTADEPDYDSEKTADKVRRMLAKEKKPVKEEAAVTAHDKAGKIVGRYKDLATAKKLKPGHKYQIHEETIDESDEGWYTHHQMYGKISKENWKKGWRYNQHKLKPFYHEPTGKWHASIKEEVEEIDESAKIAAHLVKRYGDNVRKSHVLSAAKDFGVEPSKLAKAVRKKLGKTTLDEEQIDEISAAKLTDYTAKASDARGHRNMSAAKLDKRYAGMALAHEKIRARHAKVPANEEVEVDEAVGDITVKSKSSADAYAQHTGQGKKKTSVPKDPRTGKTLYQKVTSEEAEQVDEYLVIPRRDNLVSLKKHSFDTGMEDEMKKTRQTKKSVADAKKKYGVKEEAEQIDELSTEKLLAYRKKAKVGDIPVRRGVGIDTADEKINKKTGSYNPSPLQRAKAKLRNEEAEQIEEAMHPHDAHFKKQTPQVQNNLNTMLRRGHSYPEAVKKVVGATPLKEDAEQIDEISKKLATSFLDKTEPEVDFMSGPAGKQGHQKGRKLAFSKLARHSTAKVPATNEEAELEEGMQMWKVDFPKQHAGKAIEAGSAHVKAQNISHAHKVMAKRLGVDHKLLKAKVSKSSILPEEAEQIDELSKKTLGNYTYKAASELGSKGITTGLKIAADEPTEKNFKKMANRQKGVATAVKKLTKEDIINRSIDKYVPEEVKFTPEERFLKRLNGLSESHVNTLLGLFEALNKDNQNKMIETVETREGINQLLNFALENRG